MYILIEVSRLNLSKININEFFKKNIHKITIILIIILNTLNLTLNTFDSLKIIMRGLSKETMKEYIDIAKDYQNRYEKIQSFDEGLYRMEAKANLTINDGLTFGLNGINYSGSTYSKELNVFLRNLGYSQQHVAVASDGGNTKAMEMLLGIKYTMDRENALGWSDYEKQALDDFTFYKNNYALNLGFGVTDSILEEFETNPLDGFENQNNLLKNIANLKENIFEMHEGKITKELINLDERFDKENNIYGMHGIIDENRKAKVIYEFEAEKEGESYFYIGIGRYLEYVNIYVNGKPINVKYIGNHNKLIQLGNHHLGDKVRIEFEPIATEVGIYDVRVYYENDQVLKKYYEVLSSNQMDLKEISGREYEGSIKLNGDNEYILFTIPYDKGWRAIVDGEDVDIIKVQDMLMAIKCGVR